MKSLLYLALSFGLSCGQQISSYSNPVGTSYTVPLTNSYSAPKPSNSVSYSVSAQDLESDNSRSLELGNNNVSPVYSATSKVSSNGLYPSFSKTLSSSYSAGGSAAPAGQASQAGQVSISSYSAPAVTSTNQADQKSGSEESADSDTSSSDVNERSDVASSYQAPAAAETYSGPVSTGNLYYYYYPVQAEPIVEKSDDELDSLVVILLPITVLVGFLALLSIINVAVGGRSFDSRALGQETYMESTFGSFTDLQSRVDSMLYKYFDILESQGCMDRLVCELGTKAKNLTGKDYLLKTLDWITPAAMTKRIDTFKLAVRKGYDVKHCHKYSCDSRNLIDITGRK